MLVMKKREKKVSKFVYWTPRILSIVFLLFLAMFSLDVFDMGLGFWGTIGALFMHNIPVFILAALLWISWKYEIVGGASFILAGLAYIVLAIMDPINELSLMLLRIIVISGPAFFIGALFLMNWFGKKKKH